jgi:undecaprenyl-diphosphatase
MIEQLKALDTSIFIFLNGQHCNLLDTIMWLASSKFFWIPLYIWFLWLLFTENKKRFWMVLIAIILMIVISDQTCNYFKNSVMRLRPSNDPAIKHLVHIVKGYTGGDFGFYSAHASNSFAVAIFMMSLVRSRRKLLTSICLPFAILVSYSRIYLGVHYPGDVLTGAIAGSLIALGISFLYSRAVQKLDIRLLNRKNSLE